MHGHFAPRLRTPSVQCRLQIDVLKRRQHRGHDRLLRCVWTKKLPDQDAHLAALARPGELLLGPAQELVKRHAELLGIKP